MTWDEIGASTRGQGFVYRSDRGAYKDIESEV